MIFYEIRIFSQPKIKFSLSTKTDHYKNIITHRKNMIEISVNDKIPMKLVFPDGETLIPPDSVTSIFPDIACSCTQAGEGSITLNSVAVEISQFEYVRHNCDNTDEALNIISNSSDIGTLFIPLTLSLSEKSVHINALIKKNTNSYIKNTSNGNFECISSWYEILSFVDKEFRDSLLNYKTTKISSAYYYVNKVKKYICSHYCERIYVFDIAKMLNITPNYLSSIFKKDTGTSICEYINILRVQKIREIIYNTNVPISEAVKSVGLKNMRYVEQLFIKLYGVNMRRCLQIDHEISLYHTKPWNISELNKDIYFDEHSNTNDDVCDKI